jgi:lysophospholipase L1-like esterase
MLEGAFRWIGIQDLVLYAPDDLAGYRLRPGQQAAPMGVEIAINGWGVRDRRPLDHPATGASRVLVLGDSVTWGGVQIPDEGLFTAVAERALPGTEIVNAGVNGYSAGQMVALYEGHLQGLEPDWVLITPIERDFERPPSVRLLRDNIAFPSERPHSALVTVLALADIQVRGWIGWEILKPRPIVEPSDGGPKHIGENVKRVRHLIDTLPSGTRFHLVLLPVFEEDPHRHAIIRDALDAANIPWTRLRDYVDPQPDWYTDGAHLSLRGHEAYGAALAEILGQQMSRFGLR